MTIAPFGPLFDQPDEPDPIDPAQAANYQPTSKAAAASMRGKTSRLHRLILDALEARKSSGAINEELAGLTSIRLDTVKPRAHELWRLGRIELLAKERRTSSSGSPCQVWIAKAYVNGRPTRRPRRNTWKVRATVAEDLVGRYRDLYGDLPA